MLYDNGVTSPVRIVGDESYAIPTVEWIVGPFSEELFKVNRKNGLYKLESNDCEDFAARARALANELNNRTTNCGLRGIAFGEFHYKKDTGGRHAINFAICKDGDKYRFVFYEPQDRKIVELSETEYKSCFAIII